MGPDLQEDSSVNIERSHVLVKIVSSVLLARATNRRALQLHQSLILLTTFWGAGDPESLTQGQGGGTAD